ncbi:MAG TPA: response regulator transcription factor [Acidobacteriaceae bacterium]|jgi:two-component system NarL family response regulator|nr:response regulator transcription factor [Acidobacteriaceae bacterium]
MTDTTADSIKILIVDDHAIVRQGFAALLSTVPGFAVVGEAADGEQAVEMFRKHRPDVTLMDLRLPKLNGVEAIAKIRGESPGARIIVLTTYDGDEDIYRAMQAGAKGYLLKGMDLKDLTEAVRTVHAGKSRIPSQVAEKLAERMSGATLTARELEVLQLIVAGKSNKDIGSALFISEATVKTHVNSLLGKMGVEDRTQAATTALQRGIVHLE